MKPATTSTCPAAPFQESDLLQLQIQVARRADRLWRMAGRGRGRDLIHWLQAEGEVLGRHFGVQRRVASSQDAK
jgi:hypothetical protein